MTPVNWTPQMSMSSYENLSSRNNTRKFNLEKKVVKQLRESSWVMWTWLTDYRITHRRKNCFFKTWVLNRQFFLDLNGENAGLGFLKDHFKTIFHSTQNVLGVGSKTRLSQLLKGFSDIFMVHRADTSSRTLLINDVAIVPNAHPHCEEAERMS